MATKSPPRPAEPASAEGYAFNPEEPPLTATAADIKAEGRAQARQAEADDERLAADREHAERVASEAPEAERTRRRPAERTRRAARSALGARPGRAYRSPRQILRAAPGATVAEFLVGVLAYAVGVNYLRGGAPQVKAWFAAKFYNDTSGSSAAGTSPVTVPAAAGSATQGLAIAGQSAASAVESAAGAAQTGAAP